MMILYLLNKDDLTIKEVKTISSHEFKEDIDFNDSSTIVLANYVHMDDGDFALIKDGAEQEFFGICKEMKPSDSGYKITLKQKENLFDTTIFNDGEELIQSTGMEDYIVKAISDNFISSGDALMDMDYIQISAGTHTPVAAKVSTIVDADNGVYNLKTFLGNVRQNYGIFLDFTVENGAIKINVNCREQAVLNVDTKLPEVADVSETYSVSVLAKLIVKWDTPKEYAETEAFTDEIIKNSNEKSTEYPVAKYLKAPHENGLCTDEYGNIHYQKTSDNSSWNIFNENKNTVFQVKNKSGDTTAAGKLRGKNIQAGSTDGWAALQSEASDGVTMYRLQLGVAGTITVYKSTDGGATWSSIDAMISSTVQFRKFLKANDGVNVQTIIKVFDDGDDYNYGSEMLIGAGGNVYIGGGESATSLYNAFGVSTNENLYLAADNSIALVPNCNTIANRKPIWLNASSFYPLTSGSHTLGTSTYKWGQIYSTASSISTSDRNRKHDVNELSEEQAVNLIMGIIPVTYKYNDGTSNRTHWGIIAQDIEKLLYDIGIPESDFAGFIKSQKERIKDEKTGELELDLDEEGNIQYEYGLRYEEFIAPLIKTVQIQKREIEYLKKEIEKIGS